MKVYIQLLDDNDQILAEYMGDASQPGQWRANSSQRLSAKMPAQSDNPNTGTYELFGFTFQPHLRVDRPNGLSAPQAQANSPFPGQLPVSFPTSLSKGPSKAPANFMSGLAANTKLRG